MEEKILRRLVIKAFHVDRVQFGKKKGIENGILTIDKTSEEELVKDSKIIKSIDLNIIRPGAYDIQVNNIIDIIPISTKVLGRLGEGITHTLTGVYTMLTGSFSGGEQFTAFGSSHGQLRSQLKFNRAGTPSTTDYIIHFDVTLKEDIPFNRKAPTEVHRICDTFVQGIREVLKKIDGKGAAQYHEYFDKISPNKKKVVIIKQIGGQGAMHDNQLFPNEPSGFKGGRSNIDIGNVPIIMSPNEYRDGALRAMT